MKNALLFIVLILLFACQDKPAEKRVYASQYQQDASFGRSEIDEMLDNRYDLLDETQLSDRIHWNKMKLEDSIFLTKNELQIYVYRYNSETDGSYFCYTTKGHIKLVVYGSTAVDTDIVFVLKNPSFKKIIVELIEHDRFAFNQINESKPLPPIPD